MLQQVHRFSLIGRQRPGTKVGTIYIGQPVLYRERNIRRLGIADISIVEGKNFYRLYLVKIFTPDKYCIIRPCLCSCYLKQLRFEFTILPIGRIAVAGTNP